MVGRLRAPLLAVPLAFLVACESSTAPEPRSNEDDLIAGVFGMTEANDHSGTFPCPAGGDRSVSWTSNVTFEETEFISEAQATVRHNACTVQVRQKTFTTDGEIQLKAFERRALVDGKPVHLLERMSHQKGWMRWRGPGQDRTCDVDIVETYDADTEMRSFSGTMCGRPVSFSRQIPDV